MQDIELARISQEVAERFYNLVAVGEGGRCPSRVTGCETLSEYMSSELLRIADIVRSAFHYSANLLVLQITAFGSERALAQQCHEIVQNRLALVDEESVSVGHRRLPPPGQSGEPTHAHLHHWQ